MHDLIYHFLWWDAKFLLKITRIYPVITVNLGRRLESRKVFEKKVQTCLLTFMHDTAQTLLLWRGEFYLMERKQREKCTISK